MRVFAGSCELSTSGPIGPGRPPLPGCRSAPCTRISIRCRPAASRARPRRMYSPALLSSPRTDPAGLPSTIRSASGAPSRRARPRTAPRRAPGRWRRGIPGERGTSSPGIWVRSSPRVPRTGERHRDDRLSRHEGEPAARAGLAARGAHLGASGPRAAGSWGFRGRGGRRGGSARPRRPLPHLVVGAAVDEAVRGGRPALCRGAAQDEGPVGEKARRAGSGRCRPTRPFGSPPPFEQRVDPAAQLRRALGVGIAQEVPNAVGLVLGHQGRPLPGDPLADRLRARPAGRAARG